MEIDRSALLETFLYEAAENVQVVEDALLTLEEAPDDAETVATLFRAAHTLRGNAEALALPTIARIARAVEDVLEQLRGRRIVATSALVSLLLGAPDAIRSMLDAVAAGREPTPAEELACRLVGVAQGEPDAPRVDGAAALAGDGRGRPRDGISRKILRVDLRTLDCVVSSMEQVAVAYGRVRCAPVEGDGRAATDALDYAESLFDDLREQVMGLRLVDVGRAFRAHTRAVRDLAEATGKRLRLVVVADGVEVDTTVIDALRDPITHMVRNAVDHGIEPADLRRARRKDPVGTITLRAHRRSGRLAVDVSDDGAGYDRDRILQRAIAMGLASADGPEMPDQDLYRLVLVHGFSTTEEVTDLSGRGVGMDVVARAVAGLRGTIDIESRPGKGSTVSIRVPLTLSLVEGFEVEVGNESYVVPLDMVRECIELPPATRAGPDGAGVLALRGSPVPYMRLRSLFDVGGAPPARENVVIVEHDGQRAGLAVDALRGRRQAVMRPLVEVLRRGDSVSGTTQLGDGRVALILNVPAILREVSRRTEGATARQT